MALWTGGISIALTVVCHLLLSPRWAVTGITAANALSYAIGLLLTALRLRRRAEVLLHGQRICRTCAKSTAAPGSCSHGLAGLTTREAQVPARVGTCQPGGRGPGDARPRRGEPYGQFRALVGRRRSLEQMVAGELSTFHLATHSLPLAEAPRAYQLFKANDDGCVRAVIRP
ncbi:hypothetical protein ACQPXS_03795 [Streptomyces sp. CA-142005]|uniref:hypothetical protein n=1 Tax=Streptomyces sp. CA-142005 TaxID=3240052 RepID=UPI003D9493BA